MLPATPRPPAPPDPLEDAVSSWRAAPGPEAMDAVLKASDRLIGQAASLYGGDGQSPLLRSHGRRLVAEALPRYDPDAGGAKAKTFLASQLRGLSRYGTRIREPVRVPDRVVADRGRLLRETAAFRTESGREPTDEELADRTGYSSRRIRRIRRFPSAQAAGAFEARFEGMGDGDETSSDPAVKGRRSADVETIRRELLYDDLEGRPVDRLILGHTFGIRGMPRLSRAEIVQRTGLSPGAVSQRATRLQGQLDELDEADLI